MRTALAVTMLAVATMGCDPTVKIGDPDGGGMAGGGAGGGTGGGTGNGTPLEEFCRQFVEATFALDVRCGAMTAEWAALVKTQYTDTCVTTAPPSPRTLNTVQLGACVSAMQSAACTAVFPLPECDIRLILTGTLQQDAACGDDTACQPSLYCDIQDSCPGRCRPRIALSQPVTATQRCVAGAGPYLGSCQPLPGLNMSCAPSGGSTERRECAVPYRCLPSEQCGVETALAANAPCSDLDDRCARGLQCVSSTCQPLVGANGACPAGRRCKEGLTCVSGTCSALAVSVAGGTCDATRSCVSGDFCSKAPGVNAGTCAPRRAAGGTCTASGGECQSGLHCTATASSPGVCSAAAGAGASCTLSADVYYQCRPDLYCTATMASPSGTCAPKKPRAATCASPVECLSAQCVMGSCTAPTYCYVP